MSMGIEHALKAANAYALAEMVAHPSLQHLSADGRQQRCLRHLPKLNQHDQMQVTY